MKNHPEAFKGAGLLLNEGGAGTLGADGKMQFAIEVTQKTPLWLKLTSVGKPGHPSRPPPASAVNRLIRALDRPQTYEFAPRIVPAVQTYLAAISPSAPAKWKEGYSDPSKLIADRNMVMGLQVEQPGIAGLLRNTCSITMLQASNKINVIPPEAQAQVDCARRRIEGGVGRGWRMRGGAPPGGCRCGAVTVAQRTIAWRSGLRVARPCVEFYTWRRTSRSMTGCSTKPFA